MDRLGADGDEAACLIDYLVEDYSPAQLETLRADGLTALPQGLWEPYFTSALACLTSPVPGD